MICADLYLNSVHRYSILPDCQRMTLELESFQSLILHLLKSLMIINLPGSNVKSGSMLSNITTSRSKNNMFPLIVISGENIQSLLHHDLIHGSFGSLTMLMTASTPVGSSVRQWNWYGTVVCLLIILLRTLTYFAGYLLPHLTHTT